MVKVVGWPATGPIAFTDIEKVIACGEYTTPMFLMKAGIVYQQQNDHRNAARCFSRIAVDFPNSPDVQQAKKYAARAKALSGQS